MGIHRAGKTRGGAKRSAKKRQRGKPITAKLRAIPGGEKKSTKRRISAAGSAEKAEKLEDIVEVREKIEKSIVTSGPAIAAGMIEVAKTGQLATAKYLFELAGLYPAAKETMERPQGDPLAGTILQRLGVPTEPPVGKEYPASNFLSSEAEGTSEENLARVAVEENEFRGAVMTRN